MYVPNHYQPPNSDAALEVIRSSPLAAMVSVVEGAPYVSYIPFTIARLEPDLVLAAHCARANPHWQYFERAPVLLMFHGPDGYISPRFYQDCTVNVPTWNYIAVHCTGTATVAPAEETDEILRALVNRMEGSAENAWHMEDLDAEYLRRMKNAIVPFTVRVSHVEAKFKLSQRGSDGDIAGLIAGLRQTGSERDRFIADAMER